MANFTPRIWTVILFAVFFTVGCSDYQGKQNLLDSSGVVSGLPAESISRIEKFCSDCHQLPAPASYPKSQWPEEVFQGFQFYLDSERTDLQEPNRKETVRYFQEAAPIEVTVPRSDSFVSVASSVHFEEITSSRETFASPTTSQIQWNEPSKSIYFTNMQNGELRQITPNRVKSEPSIVLATGRNICRAHLCDWDGDGKQDYLLSEIGGLSVADHYEGRVSLKLGDAAPIVLAEQLSRVVDARPFDYDEDGDLDILVADFGWLKTGSLLLLKNIGGTRESPVLEQIVLEKRHGALGLAIADMNGDSKLDFVVMYGQEFESIESHYNFGGGVYQKETIARLRDPSYNSSSFEVVDLDKDGRLDVVYSCGDAMDTFIAKPYHGVGWVRNEGNGKWDNRWLGLLVGALGVSIADLDGDGDLDVVAVGMFPRPMEHGPGTYDSICWWEQKDDLHFVRHSVERDRSSYTSVCITDFNNDGRLDIVAGVWQVPNELAFRVFANRPSAK